MSYARLPSPQPIMPPQFSPSARRIRPKMTAARRRKLLISYAPDWIITLCLAGIFFSLDFVDGYRREFSLEDTSLRHTHAVHERVPNLALYFICGVAPLLIQPLVNFFTVRSWWDLHNATLGLVLGLALTGSITQFVKITVGRPRPDLIDRCQPMEGAQDPLYGLSTWHICTQEDNHIMRDGFRSFPSGHSSLSFAGLGHLSFYLSGKLHLFDERGHAGKAWLAVSPFAAAAMVAISRTMDYRHHWHDVLVGSILGIVMSYFAYRQYYPSLASELCHRPYSPRIKAEYEDSLPLHHHRSSSEYDRHRRNSSDALPSNRRPDPPQRRYTDEPSEYELSGTVQRPDPGPLHEVWKEGAGENLPERDSSSDHEQQPNHGFREHIPLVREPSSRDIGNESALR